MGVQTKFCKKCSTEKSISEFYAHPKTADRLQEKCKECAKAAMRERHTANAPEINAALRQARKNDPERFRAVELARMGMTPERYADIYAMQRGLCAICGQPAQLAIDHDHDCCAQKRDICGACNRGLLCTSCNNGLGRFKDNPDILRAAADYLDEWKKRQANSLVYTDADGRQHVCPGAGCTDGSCPGWG